MFEILGHLLYGEIKYVDIANLVNKTDFVMVAIMTLSACFVFQRWNLVQLTQNYLKLMIHILKEGR